MELKDRLKKARKQAGLTQAELAERAGIKQASISEIERGLTKSSVHLLKLAQICDVDPFWLAEGYEGVYKKLQDGFRAFPTANADLPSFLAVWDDGDPLAHDDYEVPYYAEVEFAGGNGMTEVMEIADRRLRFSLATLRSAGVSPESAACARIRGKSMERLILDGATIGFDLTDTSIIDGEIYAFNHEGMLRVKYLQRMPGGGIKIRSEDSADFPDELMSAESFRTEVKMLGRVFWWSTVRRSPRKR